MPKKTPKEIKEFLERGEFLEQLKECDIRGLGPDLLIKGVIDKDEAEDIGFKKGAGEAVSNLYMILQKDKSTKKLLALRKCLYANTTKGTHKDLADIISEFLGIAVYESTPQSKKMKREDENGRGADDESDNEDDNDMGDPDVIKEFVGTILNDLKERSNIKDVAQQLHSKKVVKKGQYDRLAEAEVEAAGGLLYGFLIGDPSLRKLRCLRDILLEDSGHQNNALGRKIRKFLKGYEGDPVNPSQRQAQKVKTVANASKGIPDEVKFVSEASGEQQPSTRSTTDGTTRDLKIEGQGNPESITRFIREWNLLDKLRECQVSRIAADLRNKGVIDAGEMSSIQTGDPRKDAGFLYGILDRDKSVKKLRALAEALLNDNTVGNHVDLAKTIYKKYFGESQEGIPDKVKVVSEASGQQQPSTSESRSTTNGTTRDLKIEESPMKNMEVALERSLGQRSVHLKCLLEWNKAVCRIRTEPKNLKGEALGSSAGTCFFVKVENKTYCITCCHCVLGVEGWNEMAQVAERQKDMPIAADILKNRQLLNALNSDTAKIKHPEHPSFSLENAPECQLKDLLNNPENSLTIAEPELLAIECKNIPDTVKPLEIDSAVTRNALEKLSCSEGAQSVLGIVHIPEEEPHSGHVEFSHGRLTDKDDDFLTYYIDTFYGSSGSPVFLSDANLKDGCGRRVAEVGQGVVVGVHRQGDNKGMIFQNILNKLI